MRRAVAAGVSAWAGIAAAHAAPPSAPRAPTAINAADVGLVCDGVTDNAGALAALRARVMLASGPNPGVYFPPAALPCMTSAPLAAVSGTTYRAEPGTVVLKATGTSTANPMLLSAVGVSGVLLYGLTFDGNLAAAPALANVATVYQSSGVVLDHVTVQHTRGIGVLFSSAVSSSGVRDSSFLDVGNYWKTSGLASDQQQGFALCCGVNGTVSAAQSAPGTLIATASTAGMAAGNLVTGDYIQSGSVIVSLTANASILLSQPTTSALAAGKGFVVSSSDQNFAIGNTFADIGIDAVSFVNQTNFSFLGNRCNRVGGTFTVGGACVYGASSEGATINDTIAEGTMGNGIDLYRVGAATITGNAISRSGGSGISFASAAGAAISGNVSSDNNQAQSAVSGASRAGFFLSGGKIAGDTQVANVTFSGNVAFDDQPVPTQSYGFQLQQGGGATGIYVDQNNAINGYAVSAFGEGLTGYSTPVSVAAGLTQTGSSPNIGVLLGVSGTGGLGLGAHDGTLAGGPALGTSAVDLQTSRLSTAQGATGDRSAVLGGANNTASGQFSSAFGTWDTADGPGSRAWGQFAQARYRNGMDVWASGQNSVNGDSQAGRGVLRAITTSITPRRLTSDSSGVAGTQNCINLPQINFPANQEAAYAMRILVTATDVTAPGNFFSYGEPLAMLTRTTTLATTALKVSGGAVSLATGTVGTLAVAADAAVGCLSLIWTAPNADTWHVVAVVDDAEGF